MTGKEANDLIAATQARYDELYEKWEAGGHTLTALTGVELFQFTQLEVALRNVYKRIEQNPQLTQENELPDVDAKKNSPPNEGPLNCAIPATKESHTCTDQDSPQTCRQCAVELTRACNRFTVQLENDPTFK